jgi:hypothetical protein
MTDHDDPTDDLASAHLDGATTPEEDAAVTGDPAVRARLEALRSARDRLRAAADQDPVDPGRREAAIAAALAAFDDAAPSEAAAGDAVVPLAPRPARPAVRDRWRALGIAAAVALVALAVPLLSRLGSDEDDLASSGDESAESTTSAALEESAAGAARPTADAGVDAPTSSTPLGTFSSVDELAAAVQDQLGQRTAAATESAAPAAAGDDVSRPQPCAQEVEDRAAGRSRAYEGYATVDDTTVVVLVLEDADGGRTLVLLAVDDCTEVTSRPL